MKNYTVKSGDSIWDVVNLMIYGKCLVFFPLRCYLDTDGYFQVLDEVEEINPYED